MSDDFGILHKRSTREGGAIGAGAENRMLDKIGRDSIRKSYQTNADGTQTMAHTRGPGAQPEFITTGGKKSRKWVELNMTAIIVMKNYHEGVQLKPIEQVYYPVNARDAAPAKPFTMGRLRIRKSSNGTLQAKWGGLRPHKTLPGATTWYDDTKEYKVPPRVPAIQTPAWSFMGLLPTGRNCNYARGYFWRMYVAERGTPKDNLFGYVLAGQWAGHTPYSGTLLPPGCTLTTQNIFLHYSAKATDYAGALVGTGVLDTTTASGVVLVTGTKDIGKYYMIREMEVQCRNGSTVVFSYTIPKRGTESAPQKVLRAPLLSPDGTKALTVYPNFPCEWDVVQPSGTELVPTAMSLEGSTTVYNSYECGDYVNKADTTIKGDWELQYIRCETHVAKNTVTPTATTQRDYGTIEGEWYYTLHDNPYIGGQYDNRPGSSTYPYSPTQPVVPGSGYDITSGSELSGISQSLYLEPGGKLLWQTPAGGGQTINLHTYSFNAITDVFQEEKVFYSQGIIGGNSDTVYNLEHYGTPWGPGFIHAPYLTWGGSIGEVIWTCSRGERGARRFSEWTRESGTNNTYEYPAHTYLSGIAADFRARLAVVVEESRAAADDSYTLLDQNVSRFNWIMRNTPTEYCGESWDLGASTPNWTYTNAASETHRTVPDTTFTSNMTLLDLDTPSNKEVLQGCEGNWTGGAEFTATKFSFADLNDATIDTYRSPSLSPESNVSFAVSRDGRVAIVSVMFPGGAGKSVPRYTRDTALPEIGGFVDTKGQNYFTTKTVVLYRDDPTTWDWLQCELELPVIDGYTPGTTPLWLAEIQLFDVEHEEEVR